MSPQLAMVTGIDPQVTRSFLMLQPSVVDALVWYQRGRLHAEVSVTDQIRADAAELQRLCQKALGKLQTPKDITFVRVHPRAA